MTPMEKPTGSMRLLTVGRGRDGASMGLVSIEQVGWEDLVILSSQPKDAEIEHAEYMALPRAKQNALKKGTRFVSFAAFIDGVRRRENVTSRSAAQIDIDHKALDLFARLEEAELTGGVVPFAYVGHTTRSHVDESPRLRLMVPFSRDVTPEEYPRCVIALQRLFGVAEIDKGSLEPERLMYLPVANRNAPFWSWRSEGNGYVDPDYLLSLCDSLPEDIRPAKEVKPSAASDLDEAMRDDVAARADGPELMAALSAIAAEYNRRGGEWGYAFWEARLENLKGLGGKGYELALMFSKLLFDWDGDETEFERKWEFDVSGTRSDYRSLFTIAAEQCEWANPKAKKKDELPPRPKNDAAFVPASDFASAQKIEWHIKHVVQKKGLVIVYGDPGSSKSFFVLDMVAHVARGLPWRNHRVKQSKVAYIAAEGVSGFGNRLAAYAKFHNINLTDLPVLVRGGALDLKKQFLDISEQVNAIGDVGIVVIDTLAAVTPGANENTSEDMGAAVDAAQRIIEATGATVILIHHTNKAGDIRGWSGVGAAVDNRIRVERKDDVRTAHIEKQKEGRDGQAFGYRLAVVELYEDDDGDMVTSCAVEECAEEAPNTRTAKRERKPRVGDFETSHNFRVARAYLKTLEHAIYLSPKKEVTLKEAIEAIQGSLTHNPEKHENWPDKSNIKKTVTSLADHGRISMDLGVIRLPDDWSDVSEAR